MKTVISLVAAAALLAPVQAAAAQSTSAATAQPSDAQALAGLDEQIRKTVAAWKVPGVSVAVVHDGRVVFAEGYGVRSTVSGQPMTADTLFSIASMTKPFTAFTVGQLVDEGKLSFDRPVTSYIPELRFADPAATQGLTLRDMLSHRSGMPRHDAVAWHNAAMTRSELAARMPTLEFSQPMRTTWQYSNNMFVLAGLAVERASGMRWEDVARQRIFDPLGMKRSTFSYEQALADPDHADGVDIIGGKAVAVPLLVHTPVNRPVGGLYSTAREVAAWLSVQLADGKLGETQLIQPATLEDEHRTQIARGATTREPERIQVGYGLGWFTDIYRGRPLIHHGGNLPGVSTMGAMLPNEGLGVVVLVNQGDSELRDALTYAIFDRFLGVTGRDWLGEALERAHAAEASAASGRANKKASQVPNTRPSHPLADYAGVYMHPGYGRLTVSQAGRGLSAKYNDDATPIAHFHYDVFDATTSDTQHSLVDIRMQFQMDSYGRISAVEAALEPAVAPIRFLKQPDAKLSDPAYLSRLTGTYLFNGNRVAVTLAGNQLTWTTVGGSPAQLLPALGGEFTHGRRKDVRIAFELPASGQATAFRLIDATGAYEAKRGGQ